MRSTEATTRPHSRRKASAICSWPASSRGCQGSIDPTARYYSILRSFCEEPLRICYFWAAGLWGPPHLSLFPLTGGRVELATPRGWHSEFTIIACVRLPHGLGGEDGEVDAGRAERAEALPAARRGPEHTHPVDETVGHRSGRRSAVAAREGVAHGLHLALETPVPEHARVHGQDE